MSLFKTLLSLMFVVLLIGAVGCHPGHQSKQTAGLTSYYQQLNAIKADVQRAMDHPAEDLDQVHMHHQNWQEGLDRLPSIREFMYDVDDCMMMGEGMHHQMMNSDQMHQMMEFEQHMHAAMDHFMEACHQNPDQCINMFEDHTSDMHNSLEDMIEQCEGMMGDGDHHHDGMM